MIYLITFTYIIIVFSLAVFAKFKNSSESSKEISNNNYFFAGESMGAWAVSISLVISSISGTSLIALSAEAFRYDLTFFANTAALSICSIPLTLIIIPKIRRTGARTTIEFVNLRFGKGSARIAGAFYFIMIIF